MLGDSASLVPVAAAVPATGALILSIYVLAGQNREKRAAALMQLASAQNTTEITATRAVLDQWQQIVSTQAAQLEELRKQLTAMTEMHRKCESSLVDLRERVAVLEQETR